MLEIAHKVCKTCGTDRSVSEFGFSNETRDGYKYSCKECRREEWNKHKDGYNLKRKLERQGNPDKHRQEVRKYYHDNLGKIREERNNHYHENSEKLNQQSRERRQKNLEAFRKRDAEYAKEYYKGNKDKVVAKNKRWVESHKEQELTRRIKYNREHAEELREWHKEYYQKNRDKILAYLNEHLKIRRKTDLKFKLTCLLRSRVRKVLDGKSKSARTMELLGCPVEDLKKHLESMFKEGMTWGNHGLKGWHIDHIIPCASFDLSKPEEQRKCFHYTNLQPLWAADNIRKGTKTEQRKVA